MLKLERTGDNSGFILKNDTTINDYLNDEADQLQTMLTVVRNTKSTNNNHVSFTFEFSF